MELFLLLRKLRPKDAIRATFDYNLNSKVRRSHKLDMYNMMCKDKDLQPHIIEIGVSKRDCVYKQKFIVFAACTFHLLNHLHLDTSH